MLTAPFLAFLRWYRSRCTTRELMRLNDRELADIGLCRSQIMAVSRSLADR